MFYNMAPVRNSRCSPTVNEWKGRSGSIAIVDLLQRNVISAAATCPSFRVSGWPIIHDFGYLTFLSDTIVETHLQSELQLGFFLVGNVEFPVSQ